MRAGVGVGILLASSGVLGCMPKPEKAEARGPLAGAFEQASRELEVPEPLLLAIGYVETRWHTPPAAALDVGHVATGARGLMGVVERPDLPRLSEAAEQLHVDLELAGSDPATNIRAAAVVLRALALETMGRVPARLSEWRPAVARYGSPEDELAGESYADHVFEILAQGARATTDDGEELVLPASGKTFGQTSKALAGDVDFPGAHWVPARQGFFVYGRYGYNITHVIIHTTEGSYDGAISWFRNPNNPYQTSAHYVVRSSDGDITQMVREQDSAQHISDWNPWTIGIEHEAVASEGYNWFTEPMLRSSAAITRAACLRYGIPMDRAHILGHVEVPGATHVDPGPYFPWDHYMDLVHDPNNTGSIGVPSACGGLDYAGECQGNLLRWCAGGAVRQVDCGASGQACGWESDAVGNNCVAMSVDPCGGLDFAGECQGSLLRWCEGGVVRSFECSVQGETCGYQSAQLGNNCIPISAPSECDRLGYAGECAGGLLRWCENGSIRQRDCGAAGQTCGWQDDSVGNNCLYTCDSLGYVGTCDGDMLRWCENGTMRQQSCGALGQTCGYQSASVGFNCL